MSALSTEKIQADLARMCSCNLECGEQLDENTLMTWRKKVYTLPQGPKRQTKLLECYRQSLFEEGFNKTTHYVDRKRICK